MPAQVRRLPLVVPLAIALAVSMVTVRYVADPSNPLFTRSLGVLVLLSIPLPLVTGSYLVIRRGFEGAETLRIAVWSVIGAVPIGVLAVLTVLFEAIHGVSVAHASLLVVWMAGAGSIGGFLTGVYDVTRLREHRQLSTTAERLSALIDASPVAFISIDLDERVHTWNAAAERIFGWGESEAVGEPYPLVPEHREAEYRDHLDRVKAGDCLQGVETVRRRKDDSLVDVSIWSAPIHDENGDLAEMLFAYTDITDRKRRERRLTRFERAVEASGHAIYMTDPDGTITYVNPAFEEITGYSASEAVGKTPRILSSGELDAAYYDELWETITAGERWHEEVPNERKDGERYVADQTIAPITDEDGEIDRFVAIQTDVTERKETERQLRETRDFIEGALNAVPDLFFVIEPDGGSFRYWNERLPAVTGHTDEELDSLDPLTLICEQDRERIATKIQQLLETVSRTTAEVTLVTKDGSEIPYEFRARPLETREGDLLGIVGVGRDISDRKEREATLEATTTRLETIIESSPLAIFALDEAGQVTLWNPAAEELFGWTEAEVIGEPIPVVPEEQDDEFVAIIDRVMDGESFSDLEVRRRRKDGSFIDVHLSVTPLPDENGAVAGTLGMAIDVTDRKQRDQRLTVLTRVLRHNLRNKVDVIRGSGELIANRVNRDGRVDCNRLEELTEMILTAAGDLESLSDQATTVQNRLEYDQQTEPIDLVDLVERKREAVTERYSGATVSVDTPAEAWVVANETLGIAVGEAIENAIVHHDGDEPQVEVTIFEGDGQHTTVRIADDGPGIPDHERQVIESGTETALEHGSGLGLWIISWVVDSLGGTLSIEDDGQRGTAFSIQLPAAAAPSTAETSSQ